MHKDNTDISSIGNLIGRVRRSNELFEEGKDIEGFRDLFLTIYKECRQGVHRAISLLHILESIQDKLDFKVYSGIATGLKLLPTNLELSAAYESYREFVLKLFKADDSIDPMELSIFQNRL